MFPSVFVMFFCYSMGISPSWDRVKALLNLFILQVHETVKSAFLVLQLLLLSLLSAHKRPLIRAWNCCTLFGAWCVCLVARNMWGKVTLETIISITHFSCTEDLRLSDVSLAIGRLRVVMGKTRWAYSVDESRVFKRTLLGTSELSTWLSSGDGRLQTTSSLSTLTQWQTAPSSIRTLPLIRSNSRRTHFQTLPTIAPKSRFRQSWPNSRSFAPCLRWDIVENLVGW